MKMSLKVILVLTSAALVSAQRPFFAGSKPIGYPEIITTTAAATGLENKFGESDSAVSTTTQRLPIEALGDKDLVDRLSKLPIDKQPFWFLNWQALEAHRQNPMSYPQRPSSFIVGTQPGNVPNSGIGNVNPGFGNVTPGNGNVNSEFGNTNPGNQNLSPNGNVNSGFGTANSGLGNVNPSNANVDPSNGNLNSGIGNVNPVNGNENFGFANNVPTSGNVNTVNGRTGDMLNRNGGTVNSGAEASAGLANDSTKKPNSSVSSSPSLGTRNGVPQGGNLPPVYPRPTSKQPIYQQQAQNQPNRYHQQQFSTGYGLF